MLNCNCEGPNETYPSGHLCGTHAPIVDHLESCDQSGCEICHPELASPLEVRDALFWVQTAVCCGRPRIVCEYLPCVTDAPVIPTPRVECAENEIPF